uniref:Hyaluronidase n=1 Tax=Phallusia mammillata TaxID=59560 RepID=A0A6F9DFE9_9ASCI|nr:hyaluronidase-1-like [Phallusia mammillata]
MQIVCFVLLLVTGLSLGNLQKITLQNTKPYIAEPVLPQRPFVAVWNIDTGHCKSKYGVNIDLSSFDIVNNPNETHNGDNMMIFYDKMMGLYPFYEKDGTPVNGGIPQLADIGAHYHKCIEDIEKYIPEKDYSGLAVIDWESWRPVWHHNGWGNGLIYQNASKLKVKKEHPTWDDTQITAQAKTEFEKAAKNYMLGTLEIAELLRPKAKWGYYLYPDCWNYAKNGSDFTCSQQTIDFNNEIEWLFEKSTGLYPSTYVGLWFKDSNNTVLYAGNRILETLRVDRNRASNVAIPVYAYNNLVYRQTREFLTKKDVIHSSGIAAALGASGVVLWGDGMEVSKSQCQKLQDYVQGTLGPYLKMVSDAADVCSIQMCYGHGRCVLSDSAKTNIIQPPKMFTSLIETALPGLYIYTYKCQCYEGFYGSDCKHFLEME